MSCSVDEPTMTTAEKRAKDRAVHAGFCCKCKTEKSTITIRYAEYCDPCFVFSLDSKFRTALRNARPHRVVNPENLMLAFSGGSCSRSLIHLFNVFHSLPPEVVSNKMHPKVYNEIHVCHIDESSLQEQDQEGLAELSTMGKAREIAESYNYRFHGVHIEDIYDPEWSDSKCFSAVATLVTSLPKDQLAISGQAPDLLSHLAPLPAVSRQDRITKLKALLAACTTLTCKETILSHFRSSLLFQLTKRANCDVLVLGDSATKVAIQIIGLTAIGRGFSLPLETTAISNWVPNCKVLRPLKDSLLKELDIYCRLQNLQTIEGHSADLAYTVQSKAEVKSISRLTEEFITGLDKDFPSTAATVCRTAAKLTAPEVLYQDRCPLCHGPVQKGVKEWKNRITVMTPPNATVEPAKPAGQADDGCCSSNDNSATCCSSGPSNGPSACSSTRQKVDDGDALPFSSMLCYGCLTNLRDLDLKSMGNLSGAEERSFELPPLVAEGIADRLGYKTVEEALAQSTKADPRESLRAQIQEFLIDDDSDGDEEDGQP